MKTLVLKSNHGNHHGFNRKWEILETFNGEENAKNYLAELHNQEFELREDDEDFETSIASFEDDGYYHYVITQNDFDRGIFDGGHFGYANSSIIAFFEGEN